MAQEHSQRFSNSGGGGGGDGNGFNGIGGNGSCSKSSKKPKQKKVPQRGLGVAQLERIRLEEQQKRDPSSQHHQVPPIFPSSNPPSFNVPNFRHNPSSSSVPLPPPPPPLPNPLFRNSSSFPNNEFPNPNSISSLSKPSNGIGRGLDHNGFGFRGNGNLPYDKSNNPIWNSPNLIQRTQQFQHQPYSSPMLNVSSGTSSSSGISYQQMEPPSVHTYIGKNYTATMGHEEDQVVQVGRKRPYPFALSDMAGPTFTGIINFSTSDESASSRNGNTLSVDPNHPILRDPGWGSSSMPDMSPKVNGVENGNLTRDLLSLALPPTGSIRYGSNNTQPSNRLNLNLGISGNEDLPYQGTIQFPVLHQSNGGQNQPVNGLFPPARARTDEAIALGPRCNGEAGEDLDLDLKL